ncbi:ABC transporter substrate-binding protein [Streptosporangium sp. NPDC051022]|uniref:ABC transporter substrate-binding protein n=1 Tax=Streptosporangium sp. NPDC051022 TaxID=3155752 RepID=UPI003438725D
MALSCAVVAVLGAACGSGSGGSSGGGQDAGKGGKDAAKVTFVLPTPDINMSLLDVVLPQALGIYAKNGINVEFRNVLGAAGLQTLVAGKADMTWVSVPGLFPLFADNAPVKSVYETFTKRWMQLQVPDGSGVKSLTDLKGKTIGMSSRRGGQTQIIGYMAEHGLISGRDYKWVTLPSMAPQAIATAFEKGDIDAISLTLTDLAIQNGLDPATKYRDVMPAESASEPDPNVVIVATDDMIEKRPEVVAGMLRSVTEAIIDAQCDPEAALEAMRKYAPAVFANEAVAKAQFKAIIDYSRAPSGDATGYQYGTQSLTAWKKMLSRSLLDPAGSGISKDVDVSKFVANKFVSDANAFDKAQYQGGKCHG